MIIKPIYEDGKIIMLDDKEGTIEYEYQDNIADIIATKNVIEILDNLINKTDNQLKENDKKSDLGELFVALIICLYLCFTVGYLIPALIINGTLNSSIFALISIIGSTTIFGYGFSKAIKYLIQLSKEREMFIKIKKKQEYEREFQKELLKEYENNKTIELEMDYKTNPNKKIEFIIKMNKELKIIRQRLEDYKNNIIENKELDSDPIVLKKEM